MRSILAAFLSANCDVWVMTSNKDLGAGEDLDVQADVWTDVPVGRMLCACATIPRSTRQPETACSKKSGPMRCMNSLFSQDYTLLPLRRLRSKPHGGAGASGMLGQAALSIKPSKRAFGLGVEWAGWRYWHASTDQACEVAVRSLARGAVAQNLPSPWPEENPERPADVWQVAVVGRVHRVKNLHFGLRALLRAESDRRVCVHFIGPIEDAEYRQELKDLAQTNPAVEVAFVGGVPPSELPQHFHGAHYLLSATTQENFGHAIVEAWAHGCPVLISDRTPWRDLEANGIGWDWPWRAVWDAGLKRALNLNRSEWEAMSAASRRFCGTRDQLRIRTG